jgi:hypothetical protein
MELAQTFDRTAARWVQKRSIACHESFRGILPNYFQHRCEIRAYATSVAADVADADAGETDAQFFPGFEDGPDISVISVRTDTGQRLMRPGPPAGHTLHLLR